MCGCCHHDQPEIFDGMSSGFRRALWAVIIINAVMFVVEMTAGRLANSQAMQADALDFAGDAATYFLSFIVLGKSLKTRATAAMAKGISLALLGLWVFGSTVWQVFILGLPEAAIMGWIGGLALAANLVSVLILMIYRDGDSNVRSVWPCSRNDAIGNIAVVAAAGLVIATGTAWPDLVVAGIMACLFLSSAFQIIRQAQGEMRSAGN